MGHSASNDRCGRPDKSCAALPREPRRPPPGTRTRRRSSAHQHHVHQRLVQRRREVAEAVDARAAAQRLRQRLAERKRNVLVRVVVVDVQVALRMHRDVKQAVAGDLLRGRGAAHTHKASALTRWACGRAFALQRRRRSRLATSCGAVVRAACAGGTHVQHVVQERYA